MGTSNSRYRHSKLRVEATLGRSPEVPNPARRGVSVENRTQERPLPPARFHARLGERGASMEINLANVKTVIFAAALLASGSSLALAQTPPTAGPTPQAGVVHTPGGPGYGPSSPATGSSMAPVRRHHNRMYMSTRSPHHKTLKTGQPQPKQPQ
jgi:hypothetical protein